MARRILTITKCPLCGESVEQVPPAILLKYPERYDAELVITKHGLKQYLHTSCWYDMIKEKRPYEGKLYM